MRFLMLNWRDPRNPLSGGAERVTEAYLAALRERGHEVFWFANDFNGAEPAEIIRGINVVRGGGRGGSILKARQWYRRQPRFDLVIDQHHGIPWLAPWWSGTNCISYIHEVLGPIWNSFYSWPLSWVGRMQERWTHWMYRNVPFWVGCQSTKEALHRHGVRSVTVVSYGTDLEALNQLDSKPLRQPLELIAVSRLAPNKRIDHVIEAFRLVLRRGSDARLTIVGTGEMEGVLRQMAAQPDLAGKVAFTGQLSESRKNEELRRAHLLIHTSIREGWGLNVLEASAMGTPSVVYPVPGLVDSTVHDRTGIVARDESPAAVANALAELLKLPDKYQMLRQEGCKRARTFHWSQVLPKACDWLEEQARGRVASKN